MRVRNVMSFAGLSLAAILIAVVAQAQCGVPAFTGNQNSSTDIAAYMRGPYRQWCLAHGGTVKPDGNCDTSGPNWKCAAGVGAGSGEASVRPGNAPVNTMLSTFAATSGNMQARSNAMALAGTQQLLTNVFANAFSLGNNNATNPQLLEQRRQAELQAEAQRKAAEEQHKQQIFDDLSGQLKLSSPDVLAAGNITDGITAGGMQLKLSGDTSQNGGHVGITGLPGIYLNSSMPAPVIAVSGMQLKLGDDSAASQAASGAAGNNAANTPQASTTGESNGGNGASGVEASGMQLKLGNSSEGGSGTVTASRNASASPVAETASTAPAAPNLTPVQTTTTADGSTVVAGAPANTAQAQAQQIQATSQAAASASSLEAAKEQASIGWDGGTVGGAKVSAVPAPTLDAKVMVPASPQPAKAVSTASSPAVSAPPVLTANLDQPILPDAFNEAGHAPGHPIIQHDIGPMIKAMSDEQLRSQYCHVLQMVEQMKVDFLKDAGVFNSWQAQYGEAKRREYEESRDCFFKMLAEGAADLAGEKALKFGDWLANDVLKRAWTESEEIHKNAELLVAMKESVEDLNEANEKYRESQHTPGDLLAYKGELLKVFYDVSSKVDLSGFSEHGSDWVQLAKCTADYMYTTTEQALLGQELDQASKNEDEKIKAERALSNLSGQLVDEQLIRGMHPATACR